VFTGPSSNPSDRDAVRALEQLLNRADRQTGKLGLSFALAEAAPVYTCPLSKELRFDIQRFYDESFGLA
jgi:hypothetical protein